MASGGNVIIHDREKNIEQYKLLIATFADNVEGSVYHYTNAKALRGIIANNELWLSNTLFVNDRTECNALWSDPDLFDEGELSNRFVIDDWEHSLRSQSAERDFILPRLARSLRSKCRRQIV